MRIVIDMQSCQSPYSGSRGVGRYTIDLVKALLEVGREHEFFLGLNGAFPGSIEPIRAKFSGLIPAAHILVWQNHLPTAFVTEPDLEPPDANVVRAAEIVRERLLASVEPDIIFSTNLQEGFSDSAVTGVKSIETPALYATTLHDLTPFHFKEELLSNSLVAEWYYGKIKQAALSDILITDSEASRRDILNFVDIDPSKIVVIDLGYNRTLFNGDDVSAADAAGVLARYKLPKDFVFYFGGNDLCKNVDRLVRAYASLDEERQKEFPLVLGGRAFVNDVYGKSHIGVQNRIRELGLSDRVFTPGFIADEDLPVLMKLSTCFVFPSTHEGFGLPALEAMACGAAVIGSNVSAVAEVINNKIAFFDPFDESSIAKKIDEVLRNPSFQASLRIQGLKRAEEFSWQRAAEEVLAAFEQRAKTRKIEKGGCISDPLRAVINDLAPIVADLGDDRIVELARTLDETFHVPGRPTIYLDVSTVIKLDDRTGIQRVTRAVASEMIKLGSESCGVELVYSDHEDLNFYAANEYKRTGLGINAPPSDFFISFKPGDVLFFLDQAPRMAINHKKYISFLRETGVRVYFYVYDLIPLSHPEWFSSGGVEEFKELLETVCLADGVLCDSKATADDVRAFVGSRLQERPSSFKIAYAHLGMDIASSKPSRGLPDGAVSVLKALSERPTFVMVGTLEPRKGHAQVLTAFDALWSAGLDVNLAIVGRWGWKMGDFEQQLTTHSMYKSKLFWLQGVSDEYLELIYAKSACLIAASEAEGFGLPLIEAARHGTPILARDIPVFREVAGSFAYYFSNSRSADDLAEAIQDWLRLWREGCAPASKGMPTRTWRECAQGLFDALVGENWLYTV